MARPLPRIWWLNPGFAFALFLLPLALAAYLIPNEDYVISWKTNKFFDLNDLWYCVGCTAAFLAGGAVVWSLFKGRPVSEWGKFTPEELVFLKKMFNLGVFFVLFAYVIWAAMAFHSGVSLGLLKDEFLGQGGAVYEVRGLVSTLPGITTATQFAASVFILGVVLLFNGGKRSILYWLAFLLVVTGLRSIIVSERVALTEIAIPCVVLTVYYTRKRFHRLVTGLPSVLWPVAALLFLYLLFTGTEYLRTWKGAYEAEGVYGSVWSFSFDRLTGYYVTALNNGSLLYDALGQKDVPFNTFEWLWKFPILGGRFYTMVAPETAPELSGTDIFNSEGNAEFVNESGVFAYTEDWGKIGAIFFFFLVGGTTYACYFAFIQGRLFGVLLYPYLFVGLTEIARVPYWTGSRTFPSWLWLFAALFILMRRRRNQDRRRREVNQLLPRANPLTSPPPGAGIGPSGIPASRPAPTRR